LTEWRKLDLPFSGKTFVVAISGGADSVSLALALQELRNRKKFDLRFVLAHFNHNLRGVESVEDEDFIIKLAEKLEFELVLGTPNQESKIENQKGNLEQNARCARYQFLGEIAKNLDADGILTAHTLNDQAETFLLNLIRGSGIDGLSGMKPIRNQKSQEKNRELDEKTEIENIKSEIRLIRPLLTWAKREDTENFCLLNEIDFRHDSMNEDLAFRRVRIRKVLLPLLKDFNPKIVETLGKTVELLRENADSLNQFANYRSVESETRDESEFLSDNNGETKDEEEQAIEVLYVKDLKNVFPTMRRFILREWLKNSRGDLRRLGAKHFESIENLILSRKSGNKIELPGNESVVKKDGKLFYKKQQLKKV
jgi:tRNA(Ile)-lysidine synthase